MTGLFGKIARLLQRRLSRSLRKVRENERRRGQKARKTGSCVVCSNHMTSDGDGNQVPSLGHDAESNFDQAFRTRVDQRRNANVLEVWKCDRGGRKDVFFTAGDRGVRDAK